MYCESVWLTWNLFTNVRLDTDFNKGSTSKSVLNLMTASHAYEWGFYNLVHMQQKISMQIFSTAAEKKIFPLRSAEDYTH